ncbi:MULTISPECIES: DUF357 domain-containing protein [unclassified Archaeoglobus]|uniref:DUF357 domain-containing protein n=1 Tax=unclassified Archaeoglobus TaxID=2643606 RepID=UPI0025C58213|nr:MULTISPECIES: DUF357 domain-containing protein [unclassified Archaeoglobus]
MRIEDELRSETLKWLERIKERIKKVEGNSRFLENIKAYVSDSRYFVEKGDLVRAFECVVWAWAWLEIGLEVGKLRDEDA